MKPRIALLALAAAIAVVAVSADQRTSREHGVIVSAALGNGTPVTDLTASDFVVREDNFAREVIRASPAPPPSHVMILADDSDSMQARISFLRTAIAKFVPRMAALTPPPQMALTTFGERPTKRVPFTPDSTAVEKAAKQLFSINGAGAYFLQAVYEACADLRKRSATSPVLVAFVSERSPEFSNDSRKQIEKALQSAGASLWVVALQDTSHTDRSPEAFERAVVLGDVTVASGGLTRTVNTGQGIESGFEGIASLLASRVLVIYARPEQTIPPSTIEVSTKRPDVRVASPRWTK